MAYDTDLSALKTIASNSSRPQKSSTFEKLKDKRLADLSEDEIREALAYSDASVEELLKRLTPLSEEMHSKIKQRLSEVGLKS